MRVMKVNRVYSLGKESSNEGFIMREESESASDQQRKSPTVATMRLSVCVVLLSIIYLRLCLLHLVAMVLGVIDIKAHVDYSLFHRRLLLFMWLQKHSLPR